jgi:hypothetical protein
LLDKVLHIDEINVIEHIEILEELASHLSGELRQPVLTRALEIVSKMALQVDAAWALIELAPLLPEDLLEKALRESKRMEKGLYLPVVVALAPQLSPSSRQEAICKVQTEVKTIKSKRRQAEVLMGLAPQLKGKAQQKALTDGLAAARLISDKADRTKMVAALILRSVQLSANPTALREAQRKLSQIIWDYQAWERKELLEFIAHDDAAFLRAFDLPQEAYSHIAQSIIDICTQWEWL